MKLMSIPDSYRWTEISEEELNTLSPVEKSKFFKKEEVNIRQSIGEAVPTIIFQQIARNIKKNIQKSVLDEKDIERIIVNNNLTEVENLKSFLNEYLVKYSFAELSKIVELANAYRFKHAAYYTRQDICFTVIKDLPDALNYNSIKILEPSVGAGNFLPF